MCGSCKIVNISWLLFETLVIGRNVLTQKYTLLKVEFKYIFFRKLPFRRFMRIAPQQKKLLPFLPGSLLKYIYVCLEKNIEITC